MSKDIEDIIKNNLISSFKKFPTTIQDTLLKLISLRLKELYTDTQNFSDIILDPKSDRYDIIKAKAAQYNFEIRKDALLNEQIKLLNLITEIYSKRGSIDSIENMYKYYGGKLPKDVKVTIPAENIFRYTISKLSGNDRFQDNVYYRSGVYTLNINDEYDLDEIREFVLKELVTAGTKVNFNKVVSTFLEKNSGICSDNIYEKTHIDIDMSINMSRSGLAWSTYTTKYTWSGNMNLFLKISRLYGLDIIKLNKYDVLYNDINFPHIRIIPFRSNFVRFIPYENIYQNKFIDLNIELSCTSSILNEILSIHFYDRDNNEILVETKYPGYFVLGETNLGEVII